MGERRWRWTQGCVDPTAEHLLLSYAKGDTGGPPLAVARVAPPHDKMFAVQFLLEALPCDDTRVRAIIAVCRSLDFYLVDKGGRYPWAYARYHCSSTANLYDAVHWRLTGVPATLLNVNYEGSPAKSVLTARPRLYSPARPPVYGKRPAIAVRRGQGWLRDADRLRRTKHTSSE